MASKMQKRLAKDIQSVNTLTLAQNGVYIDPTTFDKNEWLVYIQGPLCSVWETGVFKLKLSFPEGYPFKPVKINFAHGIYHPNVGSGGSICLDIIKAEAWSPSYSLVAVFQSIRSLLSDPNPDSPMNGESARAFKTKGQSKYNDEVKKTIQKFGQEVKHLPRQSQHSEKPDEKALQKIVKQKEAEEKARMDSEREKGMSSTAFSASVTGPTDGVKAGSLAQSKESGDSSTSGQPKAKAAPKKRASTSANNSASKRRRKGE